MTIKFSDETKDGATKAAIGTLGSAYTSVIAGAVHRAAAVFEAAANAQASSVKSDVSLGAQIASAAAVATADASGIYRATSCARSWELRPSDMPLPNAIPDPAPEAASESAGEFLQRLGMDGQEWAREFAKTATTLGYSSMDEGWLIGWFANAIMAGWDGHSRRKPAPEATQPSRAMPVAPFDGMDRPWTDTETKELHAALDAAFAAVASNTALTDEQMALDLSNTFNGTLGETEFTGSYFQLLWLKTARRARELLSNDTVIANLDALIRLMTRAKRPEPPTGYDCTGPSHPL